MAKVQGSIVVYPSSYDADHAYYSVSNITRAYNPATNTSNYAQINLTRGSGAITYIYLKFDTSAIPENATILSVSCQARMRISTATASYVATRQIQMFSGTTAMGDPTTVPNSNTTLTLTPGTWSRSEIEDARIRLYAVRGTSNTSTSYSFVFYGATLTVTYEYDDAPPMPIRVKQNGVWVTPTKLLVKQNGAWSEASQILAKDGGEWK